jgi:hypothetical protein
LTPPSGPASPDNEDDQVPDVSPEPEKLNRQRQRPDVENDVYDPENDDHEVPLPRAKQTRTPRRAIPVPVEAEGEVVLDGEEEEEMKIVRSARVTGSAIETKDADVKIVL